jgi:hypothetical protein
MSPDVGLAAHDAGNGANRKLKTKIEITTTALRAVGNNLKREVLKLFLVPLSLPLAVL